MRDLDVNQAALAQYMSDLSEQAYAAGWMLNLEHSLWRAVIDGPFTYGYLELTSVHLVRLRELSARCGGWIRFDDEAEETFVPLDTWKNLYDPELAKS